MSKIHAMASVGRHIHRTRLETPPVAGLSQRGFALTAATFFLAVWGGYLWLHWLRPMLQQFLGAAGN